MSKPPKARKTAQSKRDDADAENQILKLGRLIGLGKKHGGTKK